jgi:hypothetical protein
MGTAESSSRFRARLGARASVTIAAAGPIDLKEPGRLLAEGRQISTSMTDRRRLPESRAMTLRKPPATTYRDQPRRQARYDSRSAVTTDPFAQCSSATSR